jgi:hypothetical protein
MAFVTHYATGFPKLALSLHGMLLPSCHRDRGSVALSLCTGPRPAGSGAPGRAPGNASIGAGRCDARRLALRRYHGVCGARGRGQDADVPADVRGGSYGRTGASAALDLFHAKHSISVRSHDWFSHIFVWLEGNHLRCTIYGPKIFEAGLAELIWFMVDSGEAEKL